MKNWSIRVMQYLLVLRNKKRTWNNSQKNYMLAGIDCHAGSFSPDFLLIVPCWKDVVTILFPSMSSTTIAPCSILPGIYNVLEESDSDMFITGLCVCSLLWNSEGKGFTLRDIVHKNSTCILFWIKSWTVCCESAIFTRSDMKKGQ